MNASTSEPLAQLMAGVELLMLDFDGPICGVFAGLPAPVVADRLRQSLRDLAVGMTAELERDDDPLSIYRRSAIFGRPVITRIYDDLVAAEIEAITSAQPTPGALEVVQAARASGQLVAVVSNNAAEAIEEYLRAHGLLSSVDYIAARRTPDPQLMKPNPAFVIEAIEAVDVRAKDSVLVGDSVTDVEAARRAGARAIGYANKPGKRERLSAAGAAAVVTMMSDLLAPRRSP